MTVFVDGVRQAAQIVHVQPSEVQAKDAAMATFKFLSRPEVLAVCPPQLRARPRAPAYTARDALIRPAPCPSMIPSIPKAGVRVVFADTHCRGIGTVTSVEELAVAQ